MGNQDVDVGEQAPLGGGQAGRHIGSTLEQYQGNFVGGQRIAQEAGFPADGVLLLVSHDGAGLQVIAGALWNVGFQARSQQAFVEAAEQVGVARLANEKIPFSRGEAPDRGGVAQGGKQEVHVSSPASCSKMAMASSSRLYSKLKFWH